jgi:hypothetical protein
MLGKAVVSSLIPDAEMSEDSNVRIAGQATSSGLVAYYLQRVPGIA